MALFKWKREGKVGIGIALTRKNPKQINYILEGLRVRITGIFIFLFIYFFFLSFHFAFYVFFFAFYVYGF